MSTGVQHHRRERKREGSAIEGGPYALVTGATAGIGEQFAVQLAEAGFNLVLVARRKQKMDALAASLHSRFDVAVEIVELDLAAEMQNALVPMQLAHEYGRTMAKRNRGGVILVASTVGHQAAPYLANYAATKAYIATQGQALNYELKKSGVDVLVLSPGPTKTEGVRNAVGIDFTELPLPMMEPSRPAAESSARDALSPTGAPPQMAARADKGDRPCRHNRRRRPELGRVHHDQADEREM